MTPVVAALSRALDAELLKNQPRPPLVDPREVPIRFSRLKHMSASALHYWQAVQDNADDTVALRFGRGFHALVLGTPVIRWNGDRRAKGYKEFAATHSDKEVLTAKEWDTAHGMFDAVMRHTLAREALFADGVTLEETIEWEFSGRKCTSRPDARYGAERNVDLKSTVSAEPGKFERDALWRGYHAQLSFYGRAIKEQFGAFPKESLCVAVEKKKPYAVTVLEFEQPVLDEGEKMWRVWFERVRVCEESDSWPAYTDAIVKVANAPDSDLRLVIDGEDFDFET